MKSRDLAVPPALTVEGISKSFSGNRVLSDLHLKVDAGEVHALLGENGSGKSTLIKILSGFHHPDPGGSVHIRGEELPFGSADHSYRLGCRFVHQDLGLVLSASVLDNLSVERGYPTRFGTIQGRRARRAAGQALERVELDISPMTSVRDLPASQRTGVALARATMDDRRHPPCLLVLDEPTATLPAAEVNHLMTMIRAIAASGVGILFVTHHLDDVYEVAQNVTVLRDGRTVGSTAVKDATRDGLIAMLVGGAIEELHRAPGDLGSTSGRVLTVSHLRAQSIVDMSFTVAAGEVLGIAGLTGSGRETVLGSIFGAITRDAGRVEVDGEPLHANRPDLATRGGVAFLPADRKTSSAVMTMTAEENLTSVDLSTFWSGWRLSRARESAEATDWLDRLQVHPAGAGEKQLSTFSGGNQQKILFGKWLRCRPRVFLLDEPTQGVDIGAKAELHKQLLAHADGGMAVVVASTDAEELAAICTRVLVVREGTIAAELVGDPLEESQISHAILSANLNVGATPQ